VGGVRELMDSVGSGPINNSGVTTIKFTPPRQGYLWPGGAMVRALDLLGSIPAVPLSGNNLGQVVHMHESLSPSSKFNASHGAVMPCGWEGNRRSCVTLAIRHRLHWFIIA